MIDVVCGVIEDGNGRYLACRRPMGKHLGGLWEFPGGKVDDGESTEAALVRELREELAIEVSVGEALEPVVCHYDRGAIQLLPFHCLIEKGVPQALEHEELRWCAPVDFDVLEWAEADLPVLAQLREEKTPRLPHIGSACVSRQGTSKGGCGVSPQRDVAARRSNHVPPPP